MMGKSSTANSLYNEQVAQIRSFQQDVSQPDVIRRAAQGFELAVIDTPGLLETDNVSTQVRHATLADFALLYRHSEDFASLCL